MLSIQTQALSPGLDLALSTDQQRKHQEGEKKKKKRSESLTSPHFAHKVKADWVQTQHHRKRNRKAGKSTRLLKISEIEPKIDHLKSKSVEKILETKYAEEESLLEGAAVPQEVYQQISESISSFIHEKLNFWSDIHSRQIFDITAEIDRLAIKTKKIEREKKRIKERNERLAGRLSNLTAENNNLQKTIEKLRTLSGNGDEEQIIIEINKIWGDSINIPADVKKRIGIINRLSETRFNASNSKHIGLFRKLINLHSTSNPTDSYDPSVWTHLGFDGNSVIDLEPTGILGLQNLVYFSDQFNSVARQIVAAGKFRFAKVGISITGFLNSLLQLRDQNTNLPPNGICKTFIHLLENPKAFEELYCSCFLLFDKISSRIPSEAEALKATQQKISEFLLADPKDMKELRRMVNNINLNAIVVK